jgi:Uma2 family endonuclease
MSAAPAIRPDEDRASEPVPSDVLLRELPLPVTIRPAAPLSDEELLAFCAANSGLEIESDADGSVRITTPAGPESSQLIQLLAGELMVWARRNGKGIVFGPDLGIRFPDKILRAPDAAWLSIERWDSLKQRRKRPGFLPFCPEFVAELRSRTDRASAVEAKMEFWMSRGAELGWLIDPKRKQAMIYRPGREPETLFQPEVLEGEGPIQGFRLEMAEFWKAE